MRLLLGVECGIICGMIKDRRETKCETATLSNEGAYTLFSFGERRLRFRAPKCLRRYLRIKTWQDGYLEVDADYGKLGIVEEYIDIRPVLRTLMISAKSFLKPIKNVEIKYA